MEGNTTLRWTAEDLRTLGASEEFILVYRHDYSGRHSVREEIESGYGLSCLEDGRVPNGGHFFEALWSGDVDSARMRADASNQRILDEVEL